MAQDAVAAERRLVSQLEKKYSTAQNKYRAALHPDADPTVLDQVREEVMQTEKDYKEGIELLNEKMREQGKMANKEHHNNLAVAGSVGIPGLAGLSYMNESMKNKGE